VTLRTTGVHHASVNVPTVEDVLPFYVDVLGLRVRTDRPDLGVGGAWLDAGDQQVHLVEGETPPGKGQHFALRVDDLDGAVAELRAGGFRVSDPSPVGTGRQSFLTDPVGNLIELHQPA
jgi:catechol 2,3-dioxygenase-like lactoylglutathione lyase family enzyme